MRGDFVIGSAPAGKKSRRLERQEESTPPPQVGLRFLGVLCLVGGLFLGLGIWKVHSVFAVRDYEMETRRLQELAQQRRDRYKALASRLSQLQRGEILKTTAEGSLGMAVPEPQEMETMIISRESQERWLAAAEAAPVAAADKEAN